MRVFTSLDCGAAPEPEPEPEGVSVIPLVREWGPGSLAEIARAARDEMIDALFIQDAPDLYSPSPIWIHLLPAAMKLLAPRVPAALSMHTAGGGRPHACYRSGHPQHERRNNPPVRKVHALGASKALGNPD